MSCGFGFSIVISHQPRNDGALPPLQTGNVAVQHQILSMFVMPAVIDHVSGVVQQSTRFQEDASLRGQTMNGMQLVKELKT